MSAHLTPRELQVLRLKCAGRLNRQIAAELGCAKRTVDAHLRNIFEKAGCHGPALAVWAVNHGFVAKAGE